MTCYESETYYDNLYAAADEHYENLIECAKSYLEDCTKWKDQCAHMVNYYDAQIDAMNEVPF